MTIKDTAKAIREAKAGYFDAIRSMSDALTADVDRIANDGGISEKLRAEKLKAALAVYGEKAAAMESEAVANIDGLIDTAYFQASKIMSKQPTPGEVAYLQALSLKTSVNSEDLKRGYDALKGNAACLASLFDMASASGVDTSGYPVIPSMVRLDSAMRESKEATAKAMKDFRYAPIVNARRGAFSVGPIGLRCELHASASVNDEFVTAIDAVGDFE